MARSSSTPDADADEAGGKHTDESPPGTPRWVRTFAIIALVLALLIGGLLLFGGGNHGPGRHTAVGPQPADVGGWRHTPLAYRP